VARFITQRYTRQGLTSLFLTCAFPLHLWTLILVFRDISWLTARTNLWDAIGVASYGMLFAFIESVVVFLALLLLGLVIPKQWHSDRRIAFLALLILIMSAWAMTSQLLFLWNVSLPAPAVQFLRTSDHPLWILYGGSLAIVASTVLLLVFLFIKSKNSVAFMQNIMERVSLLTTFYLLFDVLGLIIVVIRNVS
jgi:hypothetical protein